MFITGIIICFIPLLLAVILFKLKFNIKLLHQLIGVLFGLIAVLPISFIQFFIPDFSSGFSSPILYSLIKSIILYGLIEEILKMVLIIPLPHKNYEAKNFLLLTFIFGLSLGCFESVVYYFDHLQSAVAKGAQLLYAQIFIRIFTADIIHLTCTGLSGIFIYSIRDKNRKISPLIWAVIIHGIYDFFAGFNSGLKYFSFVVVLLAIAECRIKYKSITNDN